MNLREVRQQFLIASARYDLVAGSTDGDGLRGDAGADYYINCGQRLLDGLVNTPQTEATHVVALAPNQFNVQLQFCRVVRKVVLGNSTGSTTLQYMRPSMFWHGFSGVQAAVVPSTTIAPPVFDVGNSNGTLSSTWSDFRNCRRGYFTNFSVRPSPQLGKPLDSLTLPSSIAVGTSGLMFGESGTYTGIAFGTVSATDAVLHITGDFYSPSLVHEYDCSYWSEMFPDVLVSAARVILENVYRNTEGVKDLLATIKIQLKGIDDDMASYEAAQADEMEG